MLNERHSERSQLIYHLKVYDEDSGRAIGYLYDLTTEGAKLFTDDPIAESEVLCLVVKLPNNILRQSYIRIKAKPVWHHDGDKRHYHDYGFKFINVEFSDKVKISEFIEEFGLVG